jgi:hypothetical protein
MGGVEAAGVAADNFAGTTRQLVSKKQNRKKRIFRRTTIIRLRGMPQRMPLGATIVYVFEHFNSSF